MRHRIKGKKLNRDIKHRKALFKNLINALVIHEEIQTTESKAKVIKALLDKLISKGKKGSLHARRTIAAFLQDKKVVNKIVDDLGLRFKGRVSGFTRIIKIGNRRGDDAMIVKIELVEKKEKTKKQTTKNKNKKQKNKQTKKSFFKKVTKQETKSS